MNVKGTQRHNFDPLFIMEKMERGQIDYENALRILCEACHVVQGLRTDLGSTLHHLQELVDTRQFWVNGRTSK